MKRSSSAAAPRRPIILSSASTDCSQRIGVLTSLFIYIFLHGDKLKSHQWYQFVIQRQPNITDRWQENHWKTALHIALAEPGIDDLLRWIWIGERELMIGNRHHHWIWPPWVLRWMREREDPRMGRRLFRKESGLLVIIIIILLYYIIIIR